MFDRTGRAEREGFVIEGESAQTAHLRVSISFVDCALSPSFYSSISIAISSLLKSDAIIALQDMEQY
jgi:hypothetical protein